MLYCFAIFFVLLASGIYLISCNSDDRSNINGFVMSGEQPIASSRVTLLRTGPERKIKELGRAVSDSSGFFSISYNVPSNPNAVLYLRADSNLINLSQKTRTTGPSSVRLATVLGKLPVESDIVINERTTVATTYAMAQFFTEDGIDGTYPGLQNTAAIVENLVDLSSGGIAPVLDSPPNGESTSTRAAFNSLSNILASCVRTEADCVTLFDLATPPGGAPPENTLEAAVNIAHFPWQNVANIFTLSQEEVLYVPALTTEEDLAAWTLALRYQGNGMELNGPGNIAFDAEGNAWVGNNYVFQLDPKDHEGRVCGDDHVLKFTPTGEDAPGAPFQGGGLYGVGYGITLDPEGNVWLGNFAFQGANCPLNPDELSQSVSKFSPDGTPISPNTEGNEIGGFKGAGNTINYPQGTVSDRQGNIWIANCNGNSMTQFPGGDPDQAFLIQPMDDMSEPLVLSPFDIAIDVDGNAWVTSNEGDSVFVFDTEGNLIQSLTGDEASDAGLFLPMGIASDSLGNQWVANSGIITAPCDGNSVPDLIEILVLTLDPGFTGANASVTMINPDGTPVGPFTGGGLLIPWGIAIDGNNNVWVANF